MGNLLMAWIGALPLLAGVLILRAGLQARFRRDLVAWDLQFPSGVKPEAVTAFLVGLSGLAGPHWQHWWAGRGVVLELAATEAGLSHRLLVPAGQQHLVAQALRAHLPGVRATPLDGRPVVTVSLAAQLGLSNLQRPLNIAAPEVITAGLLSALQPLARAESVVVQWVIQPAGPVAAPVTAGRAHAPRWPWPGSSTPTNSELVKAERVKRSSALFLATPRIGVAAATPAAAKLLLGRVMAAFHATNAPGVHFYRRQLPTGLVARSLSGRFLPVLVLPCPLNAKELTAVAGIPMGDHPVAGLRLGSSRLLAPSVDIHRTGRVVALANFPGAERPLAVSLPDSLRHLHVIGPTGVGKSTLLLTLITQDMAAGRGVVVIDPKGDLAADVLDRVPPHRIGEVVVLDPADEEFPVGFNLLAGTAEGSELLVDQVVGTLHSLFKSSWGPRTDDILRAALLTLVAQPGMTLCEVPLLLTDPAFRRQLVGRVDDPVALGPFWAWYEGLSEGERAAAIGPVLNKLRAFLLRRRLRNVLGQADPPLDLAEVLRSGGILVVPLAKGLLGEEAAALLGSLVVARLWQVTMARAGQAAASRRPVMAYIDEVQDYLHLPTGIADLLAQARGLGLGLTLAHQHLGQLPPVLRDGVLANARSRVIGAGDAAADPRRVRCSAGTAPLRRRQPPPGSQHSGVPDRPPLPGALAPDRRRGPGRVGRLRLRPGRRRTAPGSGGWPDCPALAGRRPVPGSLAGGDGAVYRPGRAGPPVGCPAARLPGRTRLLAVVCRAGRGPGGAQTRRRGRAGRRAVRGPLVRRGGPGHRVAAHPQAQTRPVRRVLALRPGAGQQWSLPQGALGGSG